MTDDTLPPPELPADAALPPPPATVPPAPAPDGVAALEGRVRALLAVTVVVALAVVAGGILLWRNASATMAAQEDLDRRVAALEARPAPPDLGPLQNRVAALEARKQPDLQPLDARITALENKPPPEASLSEAGQKQIAALASRVDGITARQDSLGVRQQSDNDKLAAQIAELDAQAAQAQAAGQQLTALATRQQRAARLQAASVALDAGQPLGDLPGAPPALAQFATKPPPTEAALRLSFDDAATKAEAAGQPAPAQAGLFDRLWDRAQAGITVSRNGQVVVGDATAGVLTTARQKLVAGDLAGAVAALNGLSGPAAQAMAPWRAQAQSLLDARAALLTVAHG